MDPETRVFLQELTIRRVHANRLAHYANPQAQIATLASNLSQGITTQGEVTDTFTAVMIRSDARAEKLTAALNTPKPNGKH
jgi:hypothetical protein